MRGRAWAWRVLAGCMGLWGTVGSMGAAGCTEDDEAPVGETGAWQPEAFSADGETGVRWSVSFAGLAEADVDPSRWSATLDGAPLGLADEAKADFLFVPAFATPASADYRQPTLWIQWRGPSTPGQTLEVTHLPTQTTLRGETRTHDGAYEIAPYIVSDPAGPLTPEPADLASAADLVGAQCGVAFTVRPATRLSLANAEAVFKGTTGMDAPDRIADVAMPKEMATLLDATRADLGRIRVLIHPAADNLAFPIRLYEVGDVHPFLVTLMVYTLGDLAHGEVQTDPILRAAFVSPAPSAEYPRWTAGLFTIHEIGHLLGLSHPDLTADPDDDHTDNLMAGTHYEDDPGFPPLGRFAYLNPRQCLELAANVNGFSR